MTKERCGLSGLWLLGLVWLLSSQMVSADIIRSQTIQLHKGWNAIFLAVDPTNASPADCFRGTPVTMAAAFTGADKSIQFVQDKLSVNQQNGWDVWYAPTRADGFLTSVFSLVGNKPYLLYAESDFTLSITGNVVLGAVNWKPNSFTLTGFCLDDVSPPTFDQFFAGSPQHHPYRISRLINDTWVKVDSFQTTQMRSGEACWIYCVGSSDYQGPLRVKVPVGQALLLQGGNRSGVLLQNNSPNPLGVHLQNVSSSAQLPMAYVLRAVTATNVQAAAYDLPDNYSLPSFNAGEKRGIWLTLRPERMNADAQTGLLKITTDLGTQCWLPVSANRSTQSSN